MVPNRIFEKNGYPDKMRALGVYANVQLWANFLDRVLAVLRFLLGNPPNENQEMVQHRIFTQRGYLGKMRLELFLLYTSMFGSGRILWTEFWPVYICVREGVNTNPELVQNRIFTQRGYLEKMGLAFFLVYTSIVGSRRIVWTEFWPFYVFVC